MIPVDLVPVDPSCILPSCGLEAGPLRGTSHRTVGGGQSSGVVPRSYSLLSYAQLNFIHRRHSPPSAAGCECILAAVLYELAADGGYATLGKANLVSLS